LLLLKNGIKNPKQIKDYKEKILITLLIIFLICEIIAISYLLNVNEYLLLLQKKPFLIISKIEIIFNN
jgi:hypothetical protein